MASHVSDHTYSRISMLLTPGALRWIGRVNTLMYRASRGRLGRRIGSAPILLLTTIGRRTRQRRTTPVLYLDDPSGLVVIASNAGNRNTPGWALNLEASPDAEVQVGGTRSRVQARRVDGNERTTLWHKMNRLYAGFDDYGVRTARQIRVFVLEPSDADQELSY